MPKLKTKSSAKKRFRLTATNKVRVGQAGKRHNLRKRSNKMLRESRGMVIICAPEAKRIKNHYLHA